MQRFSDRLTGRTRQISAAIDYLLNRLSYYLIPAAICVLSVFALFIQEDARSPSGGVKLSFHAGQQPAQEGWSPASALNALNKLPLVQRQDTHLSELPYWMLVEPLADQVGERVIEFPSRHLQEIACWNARTLELLGKADRHVASGDISAFRAGFLLQSNESRSADGALCKMVHSGPALITAVSWPQAELEGLEQRFNRGSGLLEGGLLTLAFFTLFTAVINRESRYVLLAIWLVGNLRLGALSMGWDTQWLGIPISPDWILLVRKLTIAAYYIVTYALFSQVFKQELKQIGGGPVRFGQRLGLLLLVFAALVPFTAFLPLMWIIVTLGSAAIIYFLARCIILTRSRTALWYSAALAIVLLASFSEVIGAAFDFKMLVGVFNSVTAALAASLLAAFAFADQMRTERRSRLRAQAELERTYDVTPVGLFTLNADGSFLRTNNAMRQMMGADQAEGTLRWDDYFDPGSWQQLQRVSKDADSEEIEIKGRKGSDEPVWFLVRVARLGTLIEGSLQDITERQKFTDRLRFLANNDSLTGVLNRRGIEKRLEDAIERLRQGSSTSLALAYLDLDRFKLINDLYGHQTGDEVLKQVCLRVGQALSSSQDLGRIGGDEFIVVLENISLENATQLCRQLINEVGTNYFRVRSQAFLVNVSIGLVEVMSDIQAKDAISAADRACREAKTRKNSSLVIYEKHASAFRERSEELWLIEALGSTFSPAGLFLQMQPIMSLKEPLASLDFEVLIRMRGENGQVIPAGKIIAAAEANGGMAALDKWVLTTTLEWVLEHRTELANTRFVCVNLSGASLNDEAFMADVFTVLERYQSVAHYLCIEITEGVALHDIENSRRFIERLRSFGSRIALDDFGAGYTSFLYLKELPADALKIDGSFIRSLNHHPANIAILEAIIQLARNLGMRSIAEWVEDFATLEMLVELGVDYVQGYLVAQPQMPEAILAAKSSADFIIDPQFAEFVKQAASSSYNAFGDDNEFPDSLRYH